MAYSPEFIHTIVVLIPSSSEVELILDVTDSRIFRNYKVKLMLLELVAEKIKDRKFIGLLLKAEQVSCLSLLLRDLYFLLLIWCLLIRSLYFTIVFGLQLLSS